jgi:hypothetical protein
LNDTATIVDSGTKFGQFKCLSHRRERNAIENSLLLCQIIAFESSSRGVGCPVSEQKKSSNAVHDFLPHHERNARGKASHHGQRFVPNTSGTSVITQISKMMDLPKVNFPPPWPPSTRPLAPNPRKDILDRQRRRRYRNYYCYC